MSWDDLGAGLVETLPTLADRTYVVVSWRADDGVYVQFAQSSAGLHAEAAADEFLSADRQLGFDGADRMTGLGWLAPDVDPAGFSNWHVDLPWPSATARYRQLAAMSVAALRDVYGVPAPGELVYRAWQGAERPPVGVTYQVEDLAPYVARVPLPGLGLAVGRG